jgi:hypothetical protein
MDRPIIVHVHQMNLTRPWQMLEVHVIKYDTGMRIRIKLQQVIHVADHQGTRKQRLRVLSLPNT